METTYVFPVFLELEKDGNKSKTLLAICSSRGKANIFIQNNLRHQMRFNPGFQVSLVAECWSMFEPNR